MADILIPQSAVNASTQSSTNSNLALLEMFRQLEARFRLAGLCFEDFLTCFQSGDFSTAAATLIQAEKRPTMTLSFEAFVKEANRAHEQTMQDMLVNFFKDLDSIHQGMLQRYGMKGTLHLFKNPVFQLYILEHLSAGHRMTWADVELQLTEPKFLAQLRDPTALSEAIEKLSSLISSLSHYLGMGFSAFVSVVSSSMDHMSTVSKQLGSAAATIFNQDLTAFPQENAAPEIAQ